MKCKHYSVKGFMVLNGQIRSHCRKDKVNGELPCPKNTDNDCNIVPAPKSKGGKA